MSPPDDHISLFQFFYFLDVVKQFFALLHLPSGLPLTMPLYFSFSTDPTFDYRLQKNTPIFVPLQVSSDQYKMMPLIVAWT